MTKVAFEPTPNPSTMKFNLGKSFTENGFNCASVEETDKSPLANKIFGFPWTNAVYVGTDFITVTKAEWVDWELLAEPLSSLIAEHLDQGEPVVIDLNNSAVTANDSESVKQIKHIFNTEIRPAVAQDGGDVVFIKYENNNIYVHMQGACSGCPSSAQTLKFGIEARLKESFPNLNEVIAL